MAELALIVVFGNCFPSCEPQDFVPNGVPLKSVLVAQLF